MPAKPIDLGPLHFAKRGEAVAYLKKMLNRYELGDRVNSDDAEILLAVLGHHPNRLTKIGCGVEYFSVRSADYGTRCFWVNRTDGTTEKFSITGAIIGT